MSARSEDPKSLRDEVFARVFDEHWSSVRHHVEGVVVDDGVVTEIVSEVFLAAWSRLNPRKPLGRVWLFRVADRAVRARGSQPVTRSSAVAAVHDGIAGEADTADEADDARAGQRSTVLRALAVLRARERRIIVLTYWDGFTVGEIAELLRTSEASVRKTLHRAQQRMRDALRSEGVIVDD